jgi:hypothetical protein
MGCQSTRTGFVEDEPPPAARPSYEEGTVFQYRYHAQPRYLPVSEGIVTFTYRGVEDGYHVFDLEDVDTRAGKAVYTPDMALVRIERPNEIPYEVAPHDGLLVFPLSAGMEFSHEYAAVGPEPHERKRKCTVLGFVPKKVPAGIFDAYRVTCRNRRRDGPKAAIEEYYYAPELGVVISHYSNPKQLGIDYKLLRVKRP